MILWALLVLGLLSAAAPAQATAAEVVTYTVRPGDTLDELGARYLLHAEDYRTIQKLNRISDPHRLRAGSTLRFPVALLRTEAIQAQVEAFSGKVMAQNGAAAQQVGISTRVGAGTLITTGADSFVTLVFADDSRMTLPSLSAVRIATARRILLTGAVERRISVESGRSHYSVTPRTNPKDRFEVHTPLAIAAVRGTEFRVGHDTTTGRSTVNVLEGEVASSAAPSPQATTPGAAPGAVPDTVAVVANGAALYDAGAETPRLLALAPAPTLLHPGRLQHDADVVFEFAAPGTHRVQLARDAGFVDLFAESRSTGTTVHFASVPDGTLFVRAATIDSSGIAGVPVVYSFERQRHAVQARIRAIVPRHATQLCCSGGAARATAMRTYRFVLGRDAALGDRIVDEPGLSGRAIALSNLAPGTLLLAARSDAICRGKGPFQDV